LLLGGGAAFLIHAPDPDDKAPVDRELLSEPAGSEAAALPPPPELKLLPVTPEEAVKINASIPFVESVGPASKPFLVRSGNANYTTALDCLTAAIYYEAASESDNGQRAVAQVVLNRVRHPVYPASVCGVVYQGSERTTGCQFSFTCDGSLRRTPSAYGWRRARQFATAALSGKVFEGVGYATHYHTNWVVPYWAKTLDKTTAIGAHIFYRWKGHWGTPAAFRQKYSGVETDLSSTLKLALVDAGATLSVDNSALALSPDLEGGELKEDALPGNLVNATDAKLNHEGARVPEPNGANKPKLLADIETGQLKDERLRGLPAAPVAKREAPVQAGLQCAQTSGAKSATSRTAERLEALDLRLKHC
jgi:spore germination cell wall hydrolase CwlJ-like protein